MKRQGTRLRTQIDAVCDDLILRVAEGLCATCGAKLVQPSDIECPACLEAWLDKLDAEIEAFRSTRAS